MKHSLLFAIVVVLALPLADSWAEERAVSGTSIIGNKETPKSLYIVPWKKATSSEVSARPEQTLLDEVLQPLDRAEFTRELQHHQVVNAR